MADDYYITGCWHDELSVLVKLFFALLRFRLKLQYIKIVFEQLQLLVLLQLKSINTIGTSKNQAIVLQCIFRQP